VVEAYRHRNRVPGIALAITRNKEVVRVAGYGQDSGGVAMTARTRLPIASLSKSFTSLAVMQLVEAGRVNLDAPVRVYVPDFSVADTRGTAITVRQLLTHTSGLSDRTFPEKSGPIPGSLQDGVALLRTARLETGPGEKAHYHNPNYWVAARIVEVVSGLPFTDYLQRHVFAPMGMSSTTTVVGLNGVPGLVRGHIRFFAANLALPEPAWFLDGSSGVVTTAADLTQWLIMQNNGGEAANGTRIVSAAGVRAMHGGLGWSAGGEGRARLVQHGGWLFTFTAHQVLLPDRGYGIAVMANVGLGLSPVDSAVLAHSLAEMAEGSTVPPGLPVAFIVDMVLLVLALLSIGLGVRAIGRAPAWADRRAQQSSWRQALAMMPRLVPVAVLMALPPALSVVFGGRDASYLQMLYVVPSLVACLVLASAVAAGVTLARVGALRRARTQTSLL
jgi:CubicO group peptidase (beta-lactamase class C family)